MFLINSAFVGNIILYWTRVFSPIFRFYTVPVNTPYQSIGHLRYELSSASSNKMETLQAVPCLGRTIPNFYSRKEFSIHYVLGYQVSVFVRCKYTVHDIEYLQSNTNHLGN
jgi:hypothetical protein